MNLHTLPAGRTELDFWKRIIPRWDWQHDTQGVSYRTTGGNRTYITTSDYEFYRGEINRFIATGMLRGLMT